MRIIFVILFISIFYKSYSQDSLNFSFYDNTTYNYYLNSNWDSLIEHGNKALDKGYDYYYLRLRLGIAYYNKERYLKAAKHFNKALEFNKESFILEYLYYSYLFSGNQPKALEIYNSMPETRKEKIKTSKTIFKSIYADFGYGLNTDYSYQSKNIIGKSNALVQRNLTIDNYFGNIALTHKIGKYSEATHSYSGLILNWNQQFKDNNLDTRQFLHNTTQNQYYLVLNLKNKKRFSLILAYHLLWINTNYNTFTTDFSNEYGNYIFKNNTYSTREKVLLFGFEKEYNYFIINTAFGFSGLNGLKQTQPSATLSIFPLGNRNLYFTFNPTIILERGLFLGGIEKRTVYNAKIGLKIKRLWIETNGSYGDIVNYIENNGYTVINDVDKIKLRAGISLIYPIKNKMLFLNYSYQRKEGDIYNFFYNSSITTEKYFYNFNNISLGIKFNL